jgi:ribosome-interacting GTPase 1
MKVSGPTSSAYPDLLLINTGQVIAVAKSADLIMMVLDASKYEMDNHRNILTRWRIVVPPHTGRLSY